jgi:glutamate dehydrogenase/leucine dehydrogenase
VTFERLVEHGHETVVLCHDRETGMRAIIALHDTTLGPGLGGTRFRPYASEDEALVDVLRLSQGMTYKNAAAGLDLGGGKAVLLGDPRTDRTPALLQAYGRAIDRLGGAYLTAEDVGTTQADMDLLKTVTPYVTGASGGSGDPSPATAWGVFHAIRATLSFLDGRSGGADEGSLDGRHIVVVGVGKVGGALVGHLVEAGAQVTITDVDTERVAELGVRLGVGIVGVDEAHRVPCDVVSPCALGAGLNERTIPQLACRAVVGAANNQLAEPADAGRMAEAGVLYAPDFVVNAGGVINIAEELSPGGYDRGRALLAVERIAGNLTRVLEVARDEGITTELAAERVAERRIQAARAGADRPAATNS